MKVQKSGKTEMLQLNSEPLFKPWQFFLKKNSEERKKLHTSLFWFSKKSENSGKAKTGFLFKYESSTNSRGIRITEVRTFDGKM